MATESFIFAILNIVAGLLILVVRGSLRLIVGGYLLITGLFMVLAQFWW